MSQGHIEIEIDGGRDEHLNRGYILQNLEVQQKLNDHWRCKAVLRQTEDARFPIEDCLGKNLAVFVITEDGQERALFFGFILEARLTYEAYGSYTAHLDAITFTYRLDCAVRYEYYRKKTMQDIADQVVEDDQLEVEIKDIQAQGWDPARKLNYVQWGQSDFEFLNRLADDNWAWTRPLVEGIQICGKFQDGVKLKWRAEGGLIEFDIRGRLGQPAFSGASYDVRAHRASASMDFVQELLRCVSSHPRSVVDTKRERPLKNHCTITT